MLMTIAKTVAMPRDRIVGPESAGLRKSISIMRFGPQRFEQYIGQETLIRKLRIAVEAARSRNEPVDHTLLQGRRAWAKPRSPT